MRLQHRTFAFDPLRIGNECDGDAAMFRSFKKVCIVD